MSWDGNVPRLTEPQDQAIDLPQGSEALTLGFFNFLAVILNAVKDPLILRDSSLRSE